MKIRRNILFNPGPATTTDSVKLSQVVPDICPREREFGDLLTRIARQLTEVVNGGNDYAAILFGGSGTAAVEACISSVVPHGRKVLIMDNGAYGRRIIEIARIHQLEVVPYSLPWGAYPNLAAIESLLQEHRGQISHLAMVHHETTTGMLNPVERIAELARKYGVQTIVDGMSSFAGLPIDIKQTGFDYLIASSNKCIQGMAGVGFVICKQASLEQSGAIQPRSYYLNLWAQHQYFLQHREFRFTPPVQVLYALAQALHEYFVEGAERRQRRYTGNYATLIGGLRQLGFRLLLPPEQQSRLLVAVIEPTHPDYTFDAMHDYLLVRGFTIYPGKGARETTFRLATIGQIHNGDINAFIQTLAGYLTKTGLEGQLYSAGQ